MGSERVCSESGVSESWEIDWGVRKWVGGVRVGFERVGWRSESGE